MHVKLHSLPVDVYIERIHMEIPTFNVSFFSDGSRQKPLFRFLVSYVFGTIVNRIYFYAPVQCIFIEFIKRGSMIECLVYSSCV